MRIAVDDRFADGITVLHGATRTVVLVGRWAVKVPSCRGGWRNFLIGLLANMQERTFSATGWPELCPVVFSLPGGWIVVMPRCEPVGELTDEVYQRMTKHADYEVPAENKDDSFGWLGGEGGRLVAIDYG